jgi:NAD(P)-dependent dehydrogenase (short-subunit alcohol dehydrogenase family)
MMKTAFVTGGAAGIGEAICRTASRDGYRVAVFDRNLEMAQRLARVLPNAAAFAGDVVDQPSIEAALDALGAIPDLFVNNAGVVNFAPFLEADPAEFRRVIEVNLVGAFLAAQAVARRMAKRGSGSIVNITSIGGVAASPGTHAYAAAKGGLAKLTELMALELGPMGVRANCVAPGFIDGGMSEQVFRNPRARELRSSGVPMRRLGSVQDVADAVMFLASDAAAYINGHQLVVDGGVAPSVLAQLPRA